MASPIQLPEKSTISILVVILANFAGIHLVFQSEYGNFLLVVLAFVVSGFVADMFTGLAHFGFDYVFPDKMPILGPIAKEFREHHEEPTLDPSNFIVNLTKGSYASFPAIIFLFLTLFYLEDSALKFFITSTSLGICIWALFFHQIHAYAHMGSHLPAEELNARIWKISRLTTKKEQIKEFDELFKSVPIPRFIRLLQKSRIILNPATHNLHHISFETDFSSVNGWSDPFLNLFLSPIAKYYKSRSKNSKQ